VFGALVSLAPAGSLLGLACGAWPQDVREFFATGGTQPDRSALAGLPREFANARFLPLNARAMTRFTDLANSHAEPELAIHIIVIHGQDSVLEWYDLPEDPIAIARSVGEAAIGLFAATVAGAYEASTPGAQAATAADERRSRSSPVLHHGARRSRPRGIDLDR